jgi:hypothetical protein
MPKLKRRRHKFYLNELHNNVPVMQVYFKPSDGLREVDEYLAFAKYADFVYNNGVKVTYKLTSIEQKDLQL